MYHSITFRMDDASTIDDFFDDGTNLSAGYNTWDDWHLIPTKRPHVGPPELEYKYQNELMYEPIDLTNIGNLKGYYKSRSASWEFAVANGYHDWIKLYNDIIGTLHGKLGYFTLEDDPEYHYRGRFTVKDWDSQPNYSVVTIEALCEPYKYKDRTTRTFTNMANSRHVIPFASTLNNPELPVILRVTVNQNRKYMRVHGLFTDKSAIGGVRDGKYIQIDNVEAGHTYVINGENKTITDIDNSTGISYNAMYKISHMLSFPTLIDGNDNVLAISGSTAFSSTSMVSPIELSYKLRAL